MAAIWSDVCCWGGHVGTGWAIGGTQEAPGGWFALILRRMTNVSRPSRAKPNQEATQEAQGLVCAHLEARMANVRSGSEFESLLLLEKLSPAGPGLEITLHYPFFLWRL